LKEINSAISGFYDLSLEERQKVLIDFFDFSSEELKILNNFGYFSISEVDNLIENVVGSYQLPLGIACNFRINDKDYLIPMVIEEPSVIAAASNAAKIARKHGGFYSDPVKSIMISQIQIMNLESTIEAVEILLDNKQKILDLANKQDPVLKKLGGGAFDLKFRELPTRKGNMMLIVHIVVDVLDAMGANVVNTMAEAVSPLIEELCSGKVNLRIVSNLAMQRIAKSQAIFDKELLGGEEIIERIINAYEFALVDPYRAVTHNKGILNGVVALTLATGNDTRAIEAGAHGYAALKSLYTPLTKFEINQDGNLVGEIEIPLALGIVGGMIKHHPMARIALKILKVKSAEELSQVAAAVGLAQNVAALKALVSEGIQKGHMKLHARKVSFNK